MLSRAASRRRPDQEVPVMLEEEDERLKVHVGRRIEIQWLQMSQSFVDQIDNALRRLRPIGPHVSLQKYGIYLTHVF